MSAINDTPHLPPTFNRLAWSNLAAQSAEQIALAAAPIVAVLLLGVGEGQTGLLQTALTLPFILFAIPAGLLADRISRRWLMAGAEALARGGAARDPAADLARLADPAAARAARLRRGLRHGRLQRRGAGAGAVAGVAATAAGGQCADRTGAHHRLCQRTGARRRAGGMGRCGAGLRICRGALGDRGGAAVGNLRAGARGRAAAPSAAGDQGRRRLRAASSRCCGRCSSPSSSSTPHRSCCSRCSCPMRCAVSDCRRPASAPRWRCTASAWWSARCWRRG